MNPESKAYNIENSGIIFFSSKSAPTTQVNFVKFPPGTQIKTAGNGDESFIYVEISISITIRDSSAVNPANRMNFIPPYIYWKFERTLYFNPKALWTSTTDRSYPNFNGVLKGKFNAKATPIGALNGWEEWTYETETPYIAKFNKNLNIDFSAQGISFWIMDNFNAGGLTYGATTTNGTVRIANYDPDPLGFVGLSLTPYVSGSPTATFLEGFVEFKFFVK